MKKALLVVMGILFSFYTTKAQVENSWNLGVGVAVASFKNIDAEYIGDKRLFQVPRLNITAPVINAISLDLALSFNTIKDIKVIKNSAKYISIDGSLRYNFQKISEKLIPYVFIGGSIVDSERKATPTFNLGVGSTYWFSNKFGLNGQVYYKHSLEQFESMRSHTQFTFGISYNFEGGNLFNFRKTSSYGCE